ncbi:hypothetical protein D3C75_1009360 [compost metagenome]
MNECQGRTRQREHHNREEACHEHPGGFVSGEEPGKITMHYFSGGIGKVTDLEPGNGVNDMVQTDRNQQTVGRTEDERADCPEAYNPVSEITDHVLYRTPDHSDKYGQDHS